MTNLYDKTEIRTLNMLPDRSTDIHFDVDKNPTLTQQQFQQECDINFIVKQNEATGFFSHVNNRQPQYGELPDVLDYQQSLDLVAQAQDTFMALGADIRARFNNDPARLLAFLGDASNAAEAIKLGLATPVKAEPEKPTPTPPEAAKV